MSAIEDAKAYLDKLTDLSGLKKELFAEGTAPCDRTLRTWTRKGILPSVKFVNLVFYNPSVCKIAIDAYMRNQNEARSKVEQSHS